MRVVIQGPPPTQPDIQVNPVPGSGSELDIVLESASTGPAPPYLYRLEQADDAFNPINWTLLAQGANVFQGDPPAFRATGFSEGQYGRFRVSVSDSASPVRSITPIVTFPTQTQLISPTPFDYTDLTDWDRDVLVISSAVSITGTTGPVWISVTNGEYELNLDGIWRTSAQLVPLGTQFRLRMRTPTTPVTQKIMTVTVGSFTADWRVTTEAAEDVLVWPMQNPGSRLVALPGVNVWGANSYGGGGRAPGSTGVDIILINSLASTNTINSVGGLGANVYEATIEGALRYNAGSRSKFIVDCISGVANIAKSISNTAESANVTWAGQFAPNAGLFIRALVFNVTGFSDWQLWHKALYVGDDAWDVPPHNRDAFKFGPGPDRIFFTNCEFAFTMDETVDAFSGFGEAGFVYCAFLDPLHITAHQDIPGDGPEHGFGPILGAGGGDANQLSVERCIFAHMSSRAPWVGCRFATLANNIHYNMARVISDFTGSAGIFYNQRGYTSDCQYNYVGNLIVRGPNNVGTRVTAEVGSNQTWPSSAGVHVNHTAQHGWTNPGAQSGHFSATSGLPYRGSVQSSALPPGRLTNFADVYRPYANPNSPTNAERLSFLDLMEESVGVNPGSRVLGQGRTQTILNQIRFRLNGGSGEASQYINTVSEAGGWFSVPSLEINPANPGSHWHAPMPTASSRHTPYTTGTFSNGMSRVGYTPMEVWAIEQHWYRGGK